MLTLIVLGEVIAERVSSVSVAEAKYWQPRIVRWSRSENSRDAMLDNT